MSDRSQENYLRLIQENEGIIHKLIGLYVDRTNDRKDMYQEILLQAWKSFPNYRSEAKFSTWLYRVSLNTILSYGKKTKQQREVAAKVSLDDQTVDAPSDESDLLYEIVKSLNNVDKMLITLHLDGYKNPEIAEISGMKVNHVNVKIHRVKKMIIEKFKKVNNG